MYLGRNKSSGGEGGRLALILALLAGVVLGGYLGELLNLLAGAVEWLGFLRWLNYGFDFGISPPFAVDLGILTFTIGLTIKFTVCGVLGMAAAAFISRRF